MQIQMGGLPRLQGVDSLIQHPVELRHSETLQFR
jgi:hypothetical protein